jgi:predicted alpha-1,6-mannanase (GH76 family)
MYYLKSLVFIGIIATLLYPRTAYGHLPDSIRNIAKERAAIHMQRLLKLQRKTDHLWRKARWWNCANIIESVIDYNRLTGKNISKELRTIYRRNFVTFGRIRYLSPNAYDDDEWWGLTWLKAYDMTGEKRYMNRSKAIFQHVVKGSWDTVCGGGVNWQRYQRYKNSITNELFLVHAARLALEAKDSAEKQYYLNWTFKEWNWFRNSKMYNDTLIADGLNKDCSCRDEGQPGGTFTYTQGVILGGLKYLYELTSDEQYLVTARKIAHASMKNFSNDKGILSEHGGGPNHDNIQFKGIYMRYLALINTDLHDEAITAFILQNADHVWQYCRSGDGLCDFDWNAPYKKSNHTGATQGSTMDLMNAAMMQH